MAPRFHAGQSLAPQRDGDGVNEYVIHAKVKNNLVLKRILELAPNVGQFCKLHSLRPSDVGALINMRQPAMNKDGTWKKTALDLAMALKVLPEDLFTEEQRVVQLLSNEAFIEMSRRQVLELADPVDGIAARELVDRLMEHADCNPRERLFLQLRFAQDKDLEECGRVMDVSKERVRQIESKALRKLRKGRVCTWLKG